MGENVVSVWKDKLWGEFVFCLVNGYWKGLYRFIFISRSTRITFCAAWAQSYIYGRCKQWSEWREVSDHQICSQAVCLMFRPHRNHSKWFVWKDKLWGEFVFCLVNGYWKGLYRYIYGRCKQWSEWREVSDHQICSQAVCLMSNWRLSWWPCD
jgi:hypothetical protein